MNVFVTILAVLSIWDYPARQPMHDQLRNQFIVAMRGGETDTMEETCRKGVKLLPDDPTWHYNLACSLAYFADRQEEAFDELEKAIDLGFRDAEHIAADADLKRLEKLPRYGELLEYAKEMRSKPLLIGPMATADATGIFGESVALGEQNLGWDFDFGCFNAKLKLATAKIGGNTGDLYMNRDGRHAALTVTNFPGLTEIRFDQEGRRRRMDLNAPNVLFPYPTFGNSSMAFTQGPFWRSIPRSLMTLESRRLKQMAKFYLSNQTWVFPSAGDTAPVGTNGDVFASITPYWITTAGRSWSDLPYLKAALEASRSLPPETKREAVRRNLLAPTLQTLIRKSLRGVKTEADYLSPKAHPTAFPPKGVDLPRLIALAKALRPEAIEPLAVISVSAAPAKVKSPWPELTYGTAFAWAYVIRSDDPERVFTIRAKGAREFKFAQTHGRGVDVRIEQAAPDTARVTLKPAGLSPTNRVDIAVFGRNPGTDWGAPSYVSIARMDPSAPYSDPALTILPEPSSK